MTFTPRKPHQGEQVFALMGDDPLTPYFAEIYGYLIEGQKEAAIHLAGQIAVMHEPLPTFDPKVRSCHDFASRARERQRGIAVGSVIQTVTKLSLDGLCNVVAGLRLDFEAWKDDAGICEREKRNASAIVLDITDLEESMEDMHTRLTEA